MPTVTATRTETPKPTATATITLTPTPAVKTLDYNNLPPLFEKKVKEGKVTSYTKEQLANSRFEGPDIYTRLTAGETVTIFGVLEDEIGQIDIAKLAHASKIFFKAACGPTQKAISFDELLKIPNPYGFRLYFYGKNNGSNTGKLLAVIRLAPDDYCRN